MNEQTFREGQKLAPTARTLWEIQEKSARLPAECRTNLYRYVCERFGEQLKEGRARREAVRDAKTLASYQKAVRAAFIRCLGGVDTPEPKAVVAEKRNYPGFALEKLFIWQGGGCLTANVYIPRLGKPPYPAVLLTVGHTDAGKADPTYQRVAQMMAYSGFAVLVADPYGEGERFEHYETEPDFQPIQGCSGEHDLTDWKCRLLGKSMASYFVRDSMAALKVLRAREDVDADRVAITGHSGGGTQLCMMTLYAGDLLAAAAPCAYVSDHEAMLEYGVDPDNEMTWFASVAEGLDYADLLAGIAPKPLMLLCNRHDFFPMDGALRTLDAVRQLWRRAGSDDLPEIAVAESGHDYPESLARKAAQFFSLRLLGKPAALTDFAFEPLPKADLDCAKEGVLLKAFPNMKTVHQCLLDELKKAGAARAAKSLEEALAWIAGAAGEKVENPMPVVYHEGICPPYAYRCLLWRSRGILKNIGVLFRDMRQGGANLPTVIALWDGGTQRICDHSLWLSRMVEKGYRVLVMDMTATGALLPAELGSSGMQIGWGTMYKLSTWLMQSGDSLFALRLGEALSAIRMLEDAFGARDVCFYGEDEFARYAMLAGEISGRPYTVSGMWDRWEDIVSARYHDQTHTFDWCLPGVLFYFDMPKDSRTD